MDIKTRISEAFKAVINSNTESNDSGTCLTITTDEFIKLLVEAVARNFYITRIQRREYES